MRTWLPVRVETLWRLRVRGLRRLVRLPLVLDDCHGEATVVRLGNFLFLLCIIIAGAWLLLAHNIGADQAGDAVTAQQNGRLRLLA